MHSLVGKFLTVFVFLGAFALQAHADRSNISLTRAGSSLELSGQLSKDVYRYVERTEQYTVQVPYYVTVPYTDYETYYDQEYRCRWVDRPGRQECHTVRKCDDGGDPLGKKRRCWNEQVCHWVPGTREQVCGYESVRKERPVTRYRQETRYRTEYRTRVVTDSIYDHSWGTDVLVVFPRGSELLVGENEQVSVSLGGSEGNADASVSVNSSIFSYSVDKKYKNGNQIVFELSHRARFSAAELGQGTVTGMQIMKKSYLNYALEFRDAGLKGRTSTTYHIELVDIATNAVDYSGDVSAMSGGMISVPMPIYVRTEKDYSVTIQVVRQGVSIAGGLVQFTAQANLAGQLDPAPFTDANALKNFKITGANDTAQLEFVDSSPVNAEVNTTYEITVLRNVTYRDEVARGTYHRSQLATQPDGRMLILMKNMPGMSQATVNDHLDSGDGIKFEIVVRRTSERLKEVTPIQFQTSAVAKVGK